MAIGGRKPPEVAGEDRRAGESFLQRFSRRKQEARPASEATTSNGEEAPGEAPPPEPTDADMPPLETLGADSDYTGFLSAKVSEGLRRAALRKLFHSEQFNVIDELDDYAEDFTSFTALGDLVTSDMRHRLELEARKAAEALVREQGGDGEGGQADSAASAEPLDDAVAAAPAESEARDIDTPPGGRGDA